MRKHLILLVLAALALSLTPATAATTSKTFAVSITKQAFVPKAVTIEVNDSVKWTNKDTVNHQVACQKCPFTSRVLRPEGTYTYTFKQAGKFAIRDTLRGKIKGTVTVKPPPNGVSLSATPGVVKYATNTSKLTGTVSNQRAHEKVVILGRECGQAVFSKIATVDTGNHGNFGVRVKPSKKAVYEAKWKAATSKPVSVRVRPAIRLAKVAPHKFRVRVRAAQSFAGKRVLFQRFRPATGKWVRVRRVKLKAIATVGSTEISGKTFRSKVRRHRMVRIKLRSRQAAPCYLGGVSNTITS